MRRGGVGRRARRTARHRAGLRLRHRRHGLRDRVDFGVSCEPGCQSGNVRRRADERPTDGGALDRPVPRRPRRGRHTGGDRRDRRRPGPERLGTGLWRRLLDAGGVDLRGGDDRPVRHRDPRLDLGWRAGRFCRPGDRHHARGHSHRRHPGDRGVGQSGAQLRAGGAGRRAGARSALAVHRRAAGGGVDRRGDLPAQGAGVGGGSGSSSPGEGTGKRAVWPRGWGAGFSRPPPASRLR